MPPTVDELAALPDILRQTIDVIYQHLGLEPTRINDKVTTAKDIILVFFGDALRVSCSLRPAIAISLALGAEGCINKKLDVGVVPGAGIMRELAAYLQGIRPPSRPSRDHEGHNLFMAVGYVLTRRWKTARYCVAAWCETYMADQGDVAQVYYDYIDRHEHKCKSLGLTRPLVAHHTEADTSHYEVGMGGGITELQFGLSLDVLGNGGTFSLAVDSDVDGWAVPEFETKQEALDRLAEVIESLEDQLKETRHIYEAAQSEDVTYAYGDEEDDEEDE